MFRPTTILMLTGALFVSPACKKQSATTDAAPAPTEPGPTATPTDTPPAPTPPTADAPPTMANNMANCPSAVTGALTVVSKDADKVVVLITHKEEAAIAEIRKRAKALEGNSAASDAEVKHTAKGTGSAVLGKCPVALADATAKAEDVDGGSKVTLTPTDKAKLDDLFKLAEERARGAAPAPSGGGGGDGTGGGHDHGGGGGGGHGGGGGGGGENKDLKTDPKGTPVPTKEPKGNGW
jgi:hypothetical protein